MKEEYEKIDKEVLEELSHMSTEELEKVDDELDKLFDMFREIPKEGEVNG